MLRKILYSKIHMAIVTGVNPTYSGSLGVDRDVLDAAGLRSHDAILCGNCRTGERFETYLIPLDRGSRRLEVNGAAAHLAEPGDRLIVLHFAFANEGEYATFQPRVLLMNSDNTVERIVRYQPD
jgi:aspartate 1-decarboxylase